MNERMTYSFSHIFLLIFVKNNLEYLPFIRRNTWPNRAMNALVFLHLPTNLPFPLNLLHDRLACGNSALTYSHMLPKTLVLKTLIFYSSQKIDYNSFRTVMCVI